MPPLRPVLSFFPHHHYYQNLQLLPLAILFPGLLYSVYPPYASNVVSYVLCSLLFPRALRWTTTLCSTSSTLSREWWMCTTCISGPFPPPPPPSPATSVHLSRKWCWRKLSRCALVLVFTTPLSRCSRTVMAWTYVARHHRRPCACEHVNIRGSVGVVSRIKWFHIVGIWGGAQCVSIASLRKCGVSSLVSWCVHEMVLL